jgi:recombination protein RecT
MNNQMTPYNHTAALGREAEVRATFTGELAVKQFQEMLGTHQGAAFAYAVMITVMNSQALMQCDLNSVMQCAVRAASLQLSCDSSTGQAYIVPFKGKATLIPGYKGLMLMANRTGKYRYINAGPIYEGESISENRISGELTIMGHRTSDKVVGYIAAFEMFSGYSKTIYMPLTEITEHAQKYSKSYGSKDSPWTTHPKQMALKTVLRQLLTRWGYLDPHDVTNLAKAEDDRAAIERDDDSTLQGRAEDFEQELQQEAAAATATPKRSEAQILDDLYGAPAPKKAPAISAELTAARNVRTPSGTQLGTLGLEQLQTVIERINTCRAEGTPVRGLDEQQTEELLQAAKTCAEALTPLDN